MSIPIAYLHHLMSLILLQLLKVEQEEAERDLYHAFFFEPYKGLRRKVHFSNCLFEAIFSATEGMTLYYKKVQAEKQRYVPLLDSLQNRNWVQLAQNTEVLEKYVQVYTSVERMFTVSVRKELKLVQELLGLFMAKPSMLEIQTHQW